MSKLHVTHLALSGGGMHGVMFVGALRYMYLENLHKNITHIAGTSIGSYLGLLIAFKFSIEEIEEVMYACFENPEFCFIPRKDFLKLFTEYGVSTTNHIINDMKKMLYKKYGRELFERAIHDVCDDSDHQDDLHVENFDLTFRDLAKRFGVNMYISATNICSCENKIFSIDDTPDVSVFQACEASMSIPFLYKPVMIDDVYYYDGGLSNNFPIKVFANVPKENIIGMILNRDNKERQSIRSKNINLFVIAKQVFNMMNNLRVREVLFRQINECDRDYYFIPDNIPLDNFMSIKINSSGMEFDITRDQINEMIYAGFDSMHQHIQRRIVMLEKKNEGALCG